MKSLSKLIAGGVFFSQITFALTPLEVQSQVIWEPLVINSNKSAESDAAQSVIWHSVPESEQNNQSISPLVWEVIPDSEQNNQSISPLVWEVIADDERSPEPPTEASREPFDQQLTPEQVEAVLNSIPLKASDYLPLLRLSLAVPTAATLPSAQWRISFMNISPFSSDTGTGNQNYAINFDLGLIENLQLTWFVSEADDPLNAPLTGFKVQPANFWKSYGGAARWRWLNQNNWQLAMAGSLEIWEVGSGGDDSFGNAGDNASPNIFNDSGSRVFTRNIVGSISLPVSWQATKNLQFSLAPGVSFLPPNQGSNQGGAGTFYGTNPFISGGVLFQPIPELGLTASIAQPVGAGTNSFNADLQFSRVPIFSAGINWDLNPRIGLRGMITNGFGSTPATSLLALPSDNRLGYSGSFVFTPDTADTPQPSLTTRQQSLSKGGLTVNTALVPPDGDLEAWVNGDDGGNQNGFVGYSLSNIFQLFLFSGGLSNNVPQTTPQARTYANDGAWNWRIGGKAVAFSPLRGAPFWGGGRITLGRSNQSSSSGQGYVFTESTSTWEATPWLAFNVNPKLAWSGVGTLWGVGLSANVQLAPRWELIPEGNLVVNDFSQSNSTLGLRWWATESIALEAYGSTAASVLDIGQLLSAEQVRWGGRLLVSF